MAANKSQTAKPVKSETKTKGKRATPKRPSLPNKGKISTLITLVLGQRARTDQTLGKNYKKNMIEKVKTQSEHAKHLRMASNVSVPFKYAHVLKYEAELYTAAKKAFASGRGIINESDVKSN